MTVWLDTSWIRSHIADQHDEYEIVDHGVNEGRASISVIFSESIELDSTQLEWWGSLLSGLRTTDPVINIKSSGGDVVVTVEANESGYREK